jgi:hypothetical protein
MTSKSKTEKTRHTMGRKRAPPTPSRKLFEPYPAGGWRTFCGWCNKTTERVHDRYMHVCGECGH